jgi:glycosyltransferase involved in cell wall biosynthesis
VIYHDIQEPGCIKPGNKDVLLGHAWPTMSLFRRSCQQPGWNRIILMQPYCHGDDQDAFVERFIYRCDLFLAITGIYWFKDIQNSKFRHWLPKMRHLDLAIDHRDFPVIKDSFNPPGKRKFVYIGSNANYKNIPYLSNIAKELPETEFAWIGVKEGIPGVKPLGRMDFAAQEAKDCLSQYDFMLTVGKADGNPTTILEAMAWGLIPVCTAQSGYEGFPGIPNIPLNRPEEAATLLRELQFMQEEKLLAMQQDNWNALNTHFNWERFTRDVIDAIESTDSPACLPVSKTRRFSLFFTSLCHPRLDSWPLPRRLGRRTLNLLQRNSAT